MKRTIAAPVGASLLVLASVFYASYGVWTTLIGNYFGGFTVSAWRSGIIVALLVPIALLFRKLEPIRWRRDWRFLLGLVITACFIWGPLYFAIVAGGVGASLAVNYASIVVSMLLFGRFFMGEEMSHGKYLSAGLGILGILLVFLPNMHGLAWVALAAAALSGVASAAHMSIAKKIRYNATQSTILVWSASLISNIPLAILFHETQHMPSIEPEWIYLGLFTVASIIASWTSIRGLKLIDAGAAGILGLLEIVFAIAFGVILFHEKPSTVMLLGAVVIIVAAAIPYVNEYKFNKK